MPRKRREGKRRLEPTELPEAVMDVMCGGWGAIDRHTRAPDYDWLTPYDVPRDGWPALYAAHRDEIESEARRRGLACSWAAECFGAKD